MPRTLIPILMAVAMGLLLLVSAGCGLGESTPEGEIATTADDYLRALAAGNTGDACAQLTASAKVALGRPCPEEMQAIATRVGADALTAAADRGVKIDVDGSRGSAEILHLAGARLGVVRVDNHWKITSGHSLQS